MKRMVIGSLFLAGYCLLFRIQIPGVIILGGFTLIVLLWLNAFLNREEEKKKDFLQITEYMQSMGMSFLLSGTEYAALQESVELFEAGKMRGILQNALKMMEESRDGKASERAFSYIEGHYSCKKLKLLHNYIITASKVGGDYHNGIRILLKDLELWKKRQLMFYEDLRADKRKVNVAVILTILLCGYVNVLAGKRISVTEGIVYQIGMMVFWCCCVGAYILGQKWGKMDWFEQTGTYSPKEIQDKLLKHKKEALAHRIGYETRRKILAGEFTRAFPEWMLEVVLRMESKNVEVALEESYVNAPTIIRPYLGRLLGDIKNHPGQGEPYFQFASDLRVPEVGNSMKLLYGIAKGSIMDGKEHLKELIERNYQLENRACEQRMEKKRSLMYGCTFLPSLFGAGCMILTMSLLLMGFIGNLKI